jgi:glycopeptide antibiotics resistance protein
MQSARGRADADGGQRRVGRQSGWVLVAALFYIVALAVITLLPIRWSPWTHRWPHNYRPQLVPFAGIVRDVETTPLKTLAELSGNVLLFAPFGFLLPLLVPTMQRWWRTLAVGATVSLCIELYQLAWPGVRKASVNDVLMNALGALLGFAALRLTETFLGVGWPDRG